MKASRAGASRISPWFLVAVLVYAPVVLFIDGRLGAPWPWEYVLGAVTLGLLWVWTARLSPGDRLQVWLCVLVATFFEFLGSQVWGAYRYRFVGIPAFVPFGHGLVYVFAFGVAALPWVRRHERLFTLSVLGLAAAWALGGVGPLAALTGRVDVHGLLWLPIFAAVIVFSPRRALFAGIFLAVTDLELAGTLFGAWTWLPVTPWAHVASGNPPSAIAGGYTVIDGSVLILVALLARVRRIKTYTAASTAKSASPT